MKPTAPWRDNFSEIATTPAVAYLFLVRPLHAMTTDWSTLDVQMRRYSPRLRDDLRIDSAASNHLATSIAEECAALPPEAVAEIRAQDIVGLDTRLEELVGFQGFGRFHSSSPRCRSRSGH